MDRYDVQEIRREVEAAFGGEFAFDAAPGDRGFTHVSSGHRFRYIPGGEFQMGFSEKEEAAAKAIFDPIQANVSEMRPVTPRRVRPFLMGERPVLTREIGGGAPEHPNAAAYVPYDEAAAYAKGLGMTLPGEPQWEYACRAGTTTLFTFGDRLPPEADLERWLTFDFTAGNGAANGFGLCGLFVGEWCADYFTSSYASPAPAEQSDAPRVVRGGGAYFWPWQDQEWVWCMSAMRAPASYLPSGECGFRLVRDLPY